MKAVILGATGAVGTELTKALIQMPQINSIVLLGRRLHPLADITKSSKVQQYLVDVFDPQTYVSHLSGRDLAFNTFGIGQPSKFTREEFIRADLDAALEFAKACRHQGIRHFTSLGAVGSTSKSSIFYVQIKGKLEDSLVELKFPRLSLIRPSNIITPTNRYGFTQALVLALHPKIDPLLLGSLKKYRSIPIETLGRAMARNVLSPSNQSVERLEWPELQRL
jgi:uncharacterized protein YbjT (DUF2867 family)